MAVIIYIASKMPYDSRFANRFEVINESWVFVAAFPLFTFTDFVDDLERQANNGWWLIVCIAVNVLFNISVTCAIVI